MKRYYSDNRVKQQVRRLNAFCSRDRRWQPKVAKRAYVDAFGDPIPSGETYYGRRHCPTGTRHFRVSTRSMDKLVFVLFHGDRVLQDVADMMAEKRESDFVGMYRDVLGRLRMSDG